MIKRIIKITLVIAVSHGFIIAGSFAAVPEPDNDRIVITTLHFDIYHTKEMTDVGVFTAKAAEDTFVYLADYFKHELAAVTPIIIHNEKPGNVQDAFNRIDISFDGSYGTLRRELTRRMVYSFLFDILYESNSGWEISYNSGLSGVPKFITEGMAEYLSKGYGERIDKKIYEFVSSGEYKNIFDLKNIGNIGNHFTAAAGHSFFYFLESNYGKNVFEELLLDIRDYDNIFEAITVSTGKTVDELNKEWIDYYKQRYSRSTGPVVIRTDVLINRINDICNVSNKKNILIEAAKSRERILLHDSKTGKKIGDIKFPFRGIKEPAISDSGKFIVFIGKSYSSEDVYLYNIQDKLLTRITNDLFEKKYPQVASDDSFILFISNENDKNIFESYDFKIIKTDLKTNSRSILNSTSSINADSGFKRIYYPGSYFDVKDTVLSDYNDAGKLTFSSNGSATVWDDAFTGSLNIGASDFLNFYKIDFNTDFVRYNQNYRLNYYLDYRYLKYYVDFGADVFYKSDPLPQEYMESAVRELTFYANNTEAKYYGGSGFIELPVFKEFSLRLDILYNVYENVYDEFGFNGKDIKSGQLLLSLNYDTLNHDKAWPVSGTKAGVSYSENFNLNENEKQLDIINFNFSRFFQPVDFFVFSMEGSGGKISGSGSDYFRYYTGGFNSIRGHRLFAYSGHKAFLFSTEMKFKILDRFTIRWPGELRVNDLSLAFFADFGSAWDDDFKLKNSDTGKFEDLKSGIGTGLRFMLQDHVVFKLDAAWPYFYNSFGKVEIISGFEFKY